MVANIKRAAVLGSGVMGSQIAAHLVNAGIPTLMLDRTPTALNEIEKRKGLTLNDPEVRNRIVNMGQQVLLKQKPAPLTTTRNLELLTVGNFTDDMSKLGQIDWIIEVVVENLEVKKSVLQQVDEHRKEGAIVSTNTSGVSVEAMIADCSASLKRHFLGTHFFNPPRYLKLLEIIPTKDTKPDLITFMKEFAENRLGKGVVEAKDTPNFIANRIGTYGLLVTVKEMIKGNYSIGEVDSITGRLIGRPKSATFHTLDVVGLDTFIHVAANVYSQVEGKEKEIFEVPSFMNTMLEKGWIGSKSGQGFYRKKKTDKGSTIYELNPTTMDYEERRKLRTSAIERAKAEKKTERKLKALIYASDDRAGDFIWATVKPVLLYSAQLLGEIADDLVSIDKAMKWGFGWDLGPFEIWDAIGVRDSVERMEQEGEEIPDWIHQFLKDGNTTFYKTENNSPYYFHHGTYKRQLFNKKEIHIKRLKKERKVIKQNAGASLIDSGDGVALLEFHSPNNAIGLDVIQMVNVALEEANKNFEGLVIGNQGSNFCVGANIALLLMEAQDDNFFELEMVVRQFQKMAMNIKYSEKPVVAAPFGMTLGGGAEVSLPATSIQASVETYIGLVEFGVGLIPGGGGTKELYLKTLRNMPTDVAYDRMKIANSVFEKIAMAKVSTSAAEGAELGYLGPADRISMNPAHLLYEAKQKVLALAQAGYKPLIRDKIPIVGDAGYAAMLLGAKTLHYGGYASEHDLKIAEKLAYVLSGGRLKEGTYIDEQVMLDLEREAFLSLIGEPKTQARMQHMLLKGKPLRN
ncbi:3-hydroxyacyl-CoA dehydrogenase/enoyl-CoA hydratase family protein [Virgibacillus sp. W0430]|uniref:3-hydroxyacyl-CoA dehydrogenase/enoyl-CoA hydratase family protein n=1 Tax=Virgibacillus sp. W0430 TaxID=3391580 RepID=UPI003F47F427